MDDIYAEFELNEYGEHIEIMSSLLSGFTTPQRAAEWLASLLFLNEPESDLNRTWAVVMAAIRWAVNDDDRKKVVKMLIHMAGLPPALDEEGQQVEVYGLKIWGELLVQHGTDNGLS